jgi:hypothetical protein
MGGGGFKTFLFEASGELCGEDYIAQLGVLVGLIWVEAAPIHHAAVTGQSPLQTRQVP